MIGSSGVLEKFVRCLVDFDRVTLRVCFCFNKHRLSRLASSDTLSSSVHDDEHGISASEDIAEPMSVLSSSIWSTARFKSGRFCNRQEFGSACGTRCPPVRGMAGVLGVLRQTGKLGLVLSIIA
jgi:hypothetical protein